MVRAVRLDQNELKAILGTVFSIIYKVFEEFIHVRFKNVSEVDRIVYLSKNKHEILKMTFFVGLVIWVKIVVVKDFKYFQSIFENIWKNFALILSKCFFIGKHEVDSFKWGDIYAIIGIDILAEEGFGDFMR